MLLYFSLCTNELMYAELVCKDCTHQLKTHKELFSVNCSVMIKHAHKILYYKWEKLLLLTKEFKTIFFLS